MTELVVLEVLEVAVGGVRGFSVVDITKTFDDEGTPAGEAALSLYILKRDAPPQYSREFPLQNMLQPFVAGTELVWFTLPAWMVFPQ